MLRPYRLHWSYDLATNSCGTCNASAISTNDVSSMMGRESRFGRSQFVLFYDVSLFPFKTFQSRFSICSSFPVVKVVALSNFDVQVWNL